MDTSEIDLNSPAIKALGPLFKLTQVFLRDDVYPSDNRQSSSCPKHIRFKYDDDDEDDESNSNVNDDVGVTMSLNTSVETSEESVIMEVGDVFQEMSALGLPLSFQTSKQCSVQRKGKHRVMQRMADGSQSRPKDQVQTSQEVSKESLEDKSSNTSSISLPHQIEHSCSGSDASDDNVRLSNSSEREKHANAAGETCCGGLEKQIDEQVPKNMSNESLKDNLLGTVLQMEPRMNSKIATSALAPTSYVYNMLDDCAEEYSKEMDRILMEQKQTKGRTLGSFAIQLEELDSSICNEHTQVDGMPKDCQMDLDLDANDVSFSATCVEWSTHWDSFYMRYYFYNTQTQESTWYPPPGMESLASGDVSDAFDDSNAEVIGINVDDTMSHYKEPHLNGHELVEKTCSNEETENMVWGAQELSLKDLSSLGTAMVLDMPCVSEENCENETANEKFNGNVITQSSDSSSLSSIVEEACDNEEIRHQHMDEGETLSKGVWLQVAPTATKPKKKRKNRRKKKSLNTNDNHEFQPVEEHVDIAKYWCQRYLLFSKFDYGVQMDEEGWFSVTPEAIAIHHASRVGGSIVVDCFSGVGGNVIQFAKTCKHVIAIDIDPKKIEYAHNNAVIYGVEDEIDFINGDCFSLAPMLKAETIFLSPPWGGPGYLKKKSYDISLLQPYDGQHLFNTFKETASLIIMFLPRNVDINQLAELSLSSEIPWSVEVEKIFLNGKLKAVTAYFSKIS